jgi:DNA-binding NtrC family response regulator
LLRLLQQNEYYRLGSDFLRKSDARIIAASNVNFSTLLTAGTFRSDLYYRISTHGLHIPPLRERPEDIIPLTRYFVKKSAKAMKLPRPELSKELCHALISYAFPGNVREMINMVHNAIAHKRSETLVISDFPDIVASTSSRRALIRKVGASQYTLHGIFHYFPTIEEVETILVEEAIALAQGNRTVAAKMLGLSRPTLQRRLELSSEKQPEED